MASTIDFRQLQAKFDEHKKPIIIGAVVVAFVGVYFATQPSKSSRPEQDPSATQEVALQKDSLLAAAFSETTKQEEIKIEAPKPTAGKILINAGKVKEAEAKTSTTQTIITGRRPTSLEQVRAVYEVDYAPVSAVAYQGTIVESVYETPVAPVAPAEAPAAIQVAEYPENSIQDILLPGTKITVRLETGMLATALTSVPFTGQVLNVSGPNNDPKMHLNGCLVYGNAILEPITKRANAQAAYITCSTSYGELSASAIGADKTALLEGRYYERLTDRLLYNFAAQGGRAYFDSRAEGLKVEEATSAGEAVEKTTNIVSPSEYGMWKGLGGAFSSAETVLNEYSSRAVPVLAIDPGKTVTFVVSAPSEMRSMYNYKYTY